MIFSTNKRLSFVLKNMGFFLLLLLIPLVMLGSLIFGVYLDVLEKEIEKNNASIVEINKNSIDKEIRQMYSIYYQIYTDSAFTKWQIRENPINVIETLSNYNYMNDMIKSIVIYPRSGDTLYTSKGTQSIESFLSGMDVFMDWDIKTFTDKITHLSQPEIKPAINTYSRNGTSNGKLISFMFPLPPNSKYQDRTVIFLIDNLNMLSLMGDAVTGDKEDFIVLDSEKQLVSSISGKSYSNIIDFDNFIQEVKPGKRISSVLNMNGQRYFISCAVSNTTGMYYIRILPEKQALSQLYYVKSTFFYVFLLILIIGGILLLVNLFRNINPIADLLRLSERILKNTKEKADKSISIKMAVGGVLENYNMLEDQVNKSKPALKEHILSRMLYGNIEEAEIRSLENKGFTTGKSGKRYFSSVINILNTSSLNGLSPSDIIIFIENYLVDGIEGYCKYATDSKKYILILSADGWNRNTIEEKLMLLKSALFDRYELESVIGVGNAYDTLQDIGKSFIEATSAQDYMLVQGPDSIIFWSDVSKPDSGKKDWYPKSELQKLENYMLQWDSQKIEKTVNSILETVRNKKLPLGIAKCISYDIINTAIRGFNRINSVLITDEHINLDMFSLTEIETLDELYDKIVVISKKINEFIEHSREASTSQLMNLILEYLNRNCYRYDFSVEAMADHFELSSAHLRKVFKEMTNTTILSYVNSLRIEKAKELLKDTDMCLGDVVKNIGYLDTSSFVRKFKLEVGVTPGSFRQVNKRH